MTLKSSKGAKMDLKITREKVDPLLNRKEIDAEVSFEKVTPSREELRKAVAGKTASKEELVVVRLIKTIFGKTKATIKAYSYDDVISMNKIETANMLKRQTKPQKEK